MLFRSPKSSIINQYEEAIRVMNSAQEQLRRVTEALSIAQMRHGQTLALKRKARAARKGKFFCLTPTRY